MSRKIVCDERGVCEKVEAFGMDYVAACRNADSDRFFSYLKRSLANGRGGNFYGLLPITLG